ncbi:hypothetical protein IFR05_001474 [Cadophora sp. M221]|nr:hypothetical protein IFR05_001474 [Cadophora sp. M221]
MVKIQDLIRMGKMRGTGSRKTLDDCSVDGVTKVESEIQTLHSQNGRIQQYTILTVTLDGSEFLEKNDHIAQDPDRQSMPGDAACQELEELKSKIEIKANERLQKLLGYVEKVHKNNLDNARRNYRKILDHSLHTIQLQKNNIAKGHTIVHLPEKFAAEIARFDAKLWKEYQNLCTQSLEGFQADLKKQYRARLDDIERECREWLQTYAGSNLNVGAIDGITGAIARAHGFKARMPDMTETSQKNFTQEEIEATKDERQSYFWEQARKDIQDGGMTYRLEDIQLEPLFDDDPERIAGRSVSMVGVPAALLPLYQGSSNTPANQASPVLSMTDRNQSARPVQSTTSSLKGSGFQAQGLAPQYFPTRNFTPINRPYVSPYVAQPVPNTSQFGPALVPSNIWYGPSDRLLADRTCGYSVGENTIPSTQGSAVGFGSRNRTGRGNFDQKSSYPLAGTFTISKPSPRRISPTLVDHTRIVDQSMNDEEDEIPYIPRLASPISKSNIISAPRRRPSGLPDPNAHVDKSLYDDDSEEEQDGDYVPPTTSHYQQHLQANQSMGNRSTRREPPRVDLNTYVDESLYDEDYVSPPASKTPQKYQHLKIEQQTRKGISSIPSPSPPSPWTNNALHKPFEDGSGDLPDYEPSDGGDLPDYEDVEAGEADTARYSSGPGVERERDVICVSSDDEENGQGGGELGRGRKNGNHYAPISNYGALEPEFGDGGGGGGEYQNNPGQGQEMGGIDSRSPEPHVDPYASLRSSRPFASQSPSQPQSQDQSQAQTQMSNPLRRDAAIPSIELEHEPLNGTNRNDTRKKNAISDTEKAGFRKVAKNKTVKQVMQMLRDEEKKRKRGGDAEEGRDEDVDVDGGERAAKRAWNGESMEL